MVTGRFPGEKGRKPHYRDVDCSKNIGKSPSCLLGLSEEVGMGGGRRFRETSFSVFNISRIVGGAGWSLSVADAEEGPWRAGPLDTALEQR